MRKLALISSLAATQAAGDFALQMPVDCTLGDTCYIQQFLDHDPSRGTQDFMCGDLTYDGHKGTDFALASRADQAAGVNVLAAADGTVMGVRNDMKDVLQTGPDAPDVSDRECGNGIVIRHDGGYETQYCHLAQGSVTVMAGQQISAGDIIGQIGLSGQTQFPHLHLSLRKNGKPVDPFNTNGVQSCPDSDVPNLWQDDIPTPAGGIISIGMFDAVPSFDAVKAGTADTGVTSNSPAMVGWGQLFGVRVGDDVRVDITAPDGSSFGHTVDITRDQARIFRAFGKRTPQGGWPAGLYRLDVTHRRDDTVLDHDSASYRVD